MTDKTIIADEVVSRSIATVQDAVAGFDKFQAGISAIAAAHPVDVACELTTTAGMKAAIAGRAAWRDPRIALEKARKAAKAPVLELGKAIDAFAGRIEAQLLIGENNYDGQIKAHEAAVKDAAIARAKAEAERIARHEAGLNTIRLYVQKANGLDSTKLRAGIEALAAQRYGAEWEEFAAKAVIAQTETLETLHSMLNIAVAREEEAADRERQRAENARVAAELAVQKAAMDEQRRKDEEAEAARRAAAEAEQRAQAAALAEAQRKLDEANAALQDKLDKIAADEKAKADAELAAAKATELAAQPLIAEPAHAVSFMPGDPPMGTLAGLHAADVAAAPSQSDLLISQQQTEKEVVFVSPAYQQAVAQRPSPQLPSLKLGEIAAALGPGITMTEVFITETLKIKKPAQPAGARGVLFLPSQLNEALEALAELALSKRR